MYRESFRSDEKDPLIEPAYKKAEGLLNTDAINLEDFIPLYGKENVANDQKYVDQIEASIREQGEGRENTALKAATVFEAIIHQHGEQSNWFGSNASTIKASRYDDLKNGVDTIVEFQEEKKPASQLALAIDVTFSSDLKRKFDRIKKEIEQGDLTRIKYFHSENTGFRGEMTKVPRIVVGADIAVVKGLAGLWLEGQNSVLARHPIQFQILEEARLQCEGFANYARKIGQHDIAAKYEIDLRIIEDIIKEKSKTLRDFGDRDRVFASISDYMSYSTSWRPEK